MGEQMAATPYTSCATGVPLGNGDTAPLAEPLAEAWGGVGCGGAASRSGESALSMHSIVRRRLTTAVGIGVSGNARSTSATESPNSRRRKGACGTAMPSCTLPDMRLVCALCKLQSETPACAQCSPVPNVHLNCTQHAFDMETCIKGLSREVR